MCEWEGWWRGCDGSSLEGPANAQGGAGTGCVVGAGWLLRPWLGTAGHGCGGQGCISCSQTSLGAPTPHYKPTHKPHPPHPPTRHHHHACPTLPLSHPGLPTYSHCTNHCVLSLTNICTDIRIQRCLCTAPSPAAAMWMRAMTTAAALRTWRCGTLLLPPVLLLPLLLCHRCCCCWRHRCRCCCCRRCRCRRHCRQHCCRYCCFLVACHAYQACCVGVAWQQHHSA